MGLLRCLVALVGVLSLSAGPVQAVDLSRIDRSLVREPAYQTRAPKYALLVLGPEARTRVWLVLDGTTLYVDRNGNGDLTEPGEKVLGKKRDDVPLADEVYAFKVGELRDGGRRHLNVEVTVTSLSSAYGSIFSSPEVKALLARDPKAKSCRIQMDVEIPGHRGLGEGDRVLQMAGSSDLHGWLQLADRPQDAPILHFGGPWTIMLDGQTTLRINREIDLRLVVGTAGRGPGTFVSTAYEGVVPPGALPRAEITFAPQRSGDPPVKALYELKGRC